MNNQEIIVRLTDMLEQRKGAEPGSSYVASLYDKGLDSILKKVGEEAAETIMAAKDLEHTGSNDDAGFLKEKLIYEVADLWFHSMVLLADQGLTADDVLKELARRFGVSGHDEKAARQ